MRKLQIGDKVRRLSTQQDIDWQETLGIKREDVLTIRKFSGNYIYLEEDNSDHNWYAGNFELVEYNIEDDLIKASKLLNKRVYYKSCGNVYNDTVSCISLINKTNVELYEYSFGVKEALKDNDSVVVLHLSNGDSNIPFSYVVDKPSVTIKLNDSYDAEVFPDKVVVGCQTIPFSVIEEIVKINKRL